MRNKIMAEHYGMIGEEIDGNPNGKMGEQMNLIIGKTHIDYFKEKGFSDDDISYLMNTSYRVKDYFGLENTLSLIKFFLNGDYNTFFNLFYNYLNNNELKSFEDIEPIISQFLLSIESFSGNIDNIILQKNIKNNIIEELQKIRFFNYQELIEYGNKYFKT